MWSELEYMIERQCGAGRRACDAGPDALLALYGALSNCRIAFERLERFEGGEPAAVQADAVLAMDVLLATLHNVQPELELFSPNIARELGRYVHSASRPKDADTAKLMLRQQVKMLRHLLSLQATENDVDMGKLDAFTGARRRLAGFIREAYTREELFTP